MIEATNAMRHNFRLVTRINPRVAAEGHCLQHACAGNCLIIEQPRCNAQASVVFMWEDLDSSSQAQRQHQCSKKCGDIPYTWNKVNGTALIHNSCSSDWHELPIDMLISHLLKPIFPAFPTFDTTFVLGRLNDFTESNRLPVFL